MTEPFQPDLFLGRQLRDQGMKEAEVNAGEAWNRKASDLLDLVAQRQEYLTVDDLWAAGLEVPAHGANALGAIFAGAARRGVIENTHRTVQSVSPSSHARAIAIWRSLTFEGLL